MINANLDQFLEYGWYTEATLYLSGYTYWCEGCYSYEREKEKRFHFFVYKYRSIIVKGNDGETYTKRMIENNDVVDYSTVLDIFCENEEIGKQKFLESKIFDGKTFWEVENEIAWYDEI